MFRERLKKLRNEKGITQEDLAKAIGSTRSTIAGYESYKDPKEPDFDTLKKMADFFDCTTDYLLGRSDHKNLEIITLAAHRPDGYDAPPSEEAIRIAEEAIMEFVRKHGYKKNK